MSNLSKAGVALLLISLGAACGGSDETVGTNPVDGGGDTADVGAADGAAPGDSAGGGDTADATDAEAGGDTADAGPTRATPPVNLGAAGHYVILAKSGISNVPTSAITGDLGVSPATATAITGFPLTADSSNVFSTSPEITGKVYASTYSPPTPTNLTTAVSDMELAFTDAAGRPAGVTELGAGDIGGRTLTAGVYRWGTGLLIPTDVTLTGTATDVWVFQVAKDLTMSSATHVFLNGGALSKNVFWEVAGSVDVGTTAHIEGVILAKTKVALHTGASINGRLLAQTAVSMEASTVVQPAP